ncbi:MAG: hypothetical protein KBT32_08935 [Bacteroidales bacterium]|nr:hypothetical protein [Candidatus Physcocola equi]
MKTFKHFWSLLLLLLAMFVPQGAWAQYDGTPVTPAGSGTEDAPYQIASAANLYWFANHVNNGNSPANAVLTANIVVNDTANWKTWDNTTDTIHTWTPIDSYEGTFDGADHTISGLYCKEGNAALFSSTTNNATITNLGVTASYFNGQFAAGGICEYNEGSITNCYNSSTVIGETYAGGICGNNFQGSITNCCNMGMVSAANANGICGVNNSGDIKNCYNLIKNAEDNYELADGNLNLTDGSSFFSPVNFTVRGSVAYNRLANKDTMTIILPYDVPASDVNGQAYQLKSFDGQILKYEKVNDGLKANVPYLIYKKRNGVTNELLVKPQSGILIHATTSIDTVKVNGGKVIEFGAYKKEVFLSGDRSDEYDYYGYKGGKFLKAKQDITMSPFRVAIRLTKTAAGNTTRAFSLNNVSLNELNVVFDDNVTGVKVTNTTSELVGKVNVYDALGHAIRLNVDAENCLDGLKDGVYVVNGKKIIVKSEK